MSIERFDAEILHLLMEGPVDVAPHMPGADANDRVLKTVDPSATAGNNGGERPYTFYVSTYGSTTGCLPAIATRAWAELDAAMSVKMPDTDACFRPVTPRRLRASMDAEAQIDAASRRCGNARQYDAPSRTLFARGHVFGLPRMQQTSKFAVMLAAAGVASALSAALAAIERATAFPSDKGAQPAFAVCTLSQWRSAR
ncbi:MAG: hypothetical protein ACLRM9_09270 [Collinsella aerofaciens]